MKKKHAYKQHTTKTQEATRVLNSSRSSMTMIWIPAFFVALVTLLVYLPAVNNGFVNWDDQAYVYENQNIQSFDLGFLKWSLTAVVASLWHPLTLISLALDHAIWGLDPWGYHLTNILIHSLNTFLVFMLAMRLIECNNLWKDKKKAMISAFTAALLFGIHPLHVESIAWVSERKDVLSAFFFLLTLLTYIKYVQAKGSTKIYLYVLALISFTLALMSKPMVVTLPVVLLILDYYPFKRLELKNAKTMLLEKLPFFSLSFLTALATLWAHKTSGALPTLEIFPLTMRILSAMYAYIFYLAKMILPISLAPFYPYPEWMELFTFKYIAAYVFFLFIILIAIWSIRKHKLFSAVLLYYFIILIPVIGIVQVGKQMAADRYTYLPSLGPFLLIGLGLGCFFERSSRNIRLAVIAVIILISAIQANKTLKQIAIWHDSVTFWSHEINLFPTASPVPYNNRGLAFASIGEQRAAINDFSTAIEIDPGHIIAYKNRGVAYNNVGDYEEAIKDFDKAIKAQPDDAWVYVGRGDAFNSMGELESAIRDFGKAIDLNPNLKEAYLNRGIAYHSLGSFVSAIKDYSESIRLDPLFADVYNNRGSALNSIENHREAIKDFSKAIELSPGHAGAYYNRGTVYKALGNYQEAIRDLGKATEFNPQDAMAYADLGVCYSQLENIAQATYYYKIAANLGSKDAQNFLSRRGIMWE